MTDAKYDVSTGQFVNRRSGQAIPDEEPTFILRARDIRAAAAVRQYANSCLDPDHARDCHAVADAFDRWAEENPEQMKEPDR